MTSDWSNFNSSRQIIGKTHSVTTWAPKTQGTRTCPFTRHTNVMRTMSQNCINCRRLKHDRMNEITEIGDKHRTRPTTTPRLSPAACSGWPKTGATLDRHLTKEGAVWTGHSSLLFSWEILHPNENGQRMADDLYAKYITLYATLLQSSPSCKCCRHMLFRV